MRLLRLEIKRICKTRATWLLLCAALLLSVFMAYLPATFEHGTTVDEKGEKVELSGFDAVRYFQSYNETTYGEVTPEKIEEAMALYQKTVQKWDVSYMWSLPEEAYEDLANIQPLYPFIMKVSEVFAKDGLGTPLADVDVQETKQYYDRLESRLISIMDMEQKNYPSAKEDALRRFSKVKKPYVYYYGASQNSMDYEALLIFVIMILCVVIAAPVFSADYQTGADDILRCTKHGRLELAAAKTASAFLITSAAFILCLTVWILTTNSLFGWEGSKTSMQLIFSVTALPAYTIGKLQWVNMWGSLLFFLAGISFTLLLSSKIKNSMMALAAGLLAAFLPTISYVSIPAEYAGWVQALLPGGGIGLSNCFLYSLTDFEYLHIGDASIWYVDMRIAAALIEIPLFTGLTFYFYCRRKA